MDFVLNNWLLIAVALSSGMLLLWPQIQGASSAGGLTPAAAVRAMNHEKAVVVDVSEADEFATGHIVGARHIPVGTVAEQLPGLIKNKATPLVFVCPSGARSQRAVAAARKLGYEQAQNLSGGLKAWREAGLPLEKA